MLLRGGQILSVLRSKLPTMTRLCSLRCGLTDLVSGGSFLKDQGMIGHLNLLILEEIFTVNLLVTTILLGIRDIITVTLMLSVIAITTVTIACITINTITKIFSLLQVYQILSNSIFLHRTDSTVFRMM